MAKKLKITHEGYTFTRTTVRDYSHIVVGKRTCEQTLNGEVFPIGSWICLDWCGRLDLAQKKLRYWMGRPHYTDITILPVN